MKRILITGAREWRDRERLYDSIFYWAQQNTEPNEEIILVHGGAARGADRMAHDYAALADWLTEEVHEADWTWGKGAGMHRNSEMVALGADVCLAFIRGEARGTRHCAGEAAKAGIPVIRVVDNPGEDS